MAEWSDMGRYIYMLAFSEVDYHNKAYLVAKTILLNNYDIFIISELLNNYHVFIRITYQ